MKSLNYIKHCMYLRNDSEKNLNMAKALAPAFLRIAGPNSNLYTFQRDGVVIPKDPSSFVLTGKPSSI